MKYVTRAAVVIAAAALLNAVLPAPAGASAPALTWAGRAAMPTPRWISAVATTLDGDIIVFGGRTDSGVSGAVERYHPATNTWTSLAPMPIPRAATRAVVTRDGTILVVGGYFEGSDATGIVEAYNPTTNTWSPRSNLPVNAMSPGAAYGPDGTVYLFGGYPGCCFSYLNTVFAYDPDTDTWQSRAPMPTPREGPAAALAADNKIYVIGGNGTGPIEHTVEVYDPAANTWQVKPPMPIGGTGLSLIAAPTGKLYATGYDEFGTVTDYDPATGVWDSNTPMPTARVRVATALAGDGQLYAIGGLAQPAGVVSSVTERASFGSPPEPSVYNVALASRASSSNSSVTATAATAVPAGATMTVSIATGTFAGAVGCTDSKGNTYAVVADKNTGNGRLFVCSATVTTALAAGDTVTATYPGFSGLSVASGNAITGLSGGGVVDQVSTASGNNPNPDSGNVTTTQATELLFGVVAHNSVPTFSPGAGFTVVGAITAGTGSGTRTVSPEFKLVTGVGTYAANGTLSGGQQWRATVTTYA